MCITKQNNAFSLKVHLILRDTIMFLGLNRDLLNYICIRSTYLDYLLYLSLLISFYTTHLFAYVLVK